MERHRESRFPQSLRYPFFLIGLVILIGGGFGALQVKQAPIALDIAVAVVGFAFLVLAVIFP